MKKIKIIDIGQSAFKQPALVKLLKEGRKTNAGTSGACIVTRMKDESLINGYYPPQKRSGGKLKRWNPI